MNNKVQDIKVTKTLTYVLGLNTKHHHDIVRWNSYHTLISAISTVSISLRNRLTLLALTIWSGRWFQGSTTPLAKQYRARQ